MFARSVVAAFVAVPLIAHSVFAAEKACTRTYKVKAGDWCDTISAANNVSTYQLAAVNPDINAGCDNLQIDQVLCLGTEGEDCTTTHVVEENDVCETIMSTYAINATLLWSNNPQIDADCANLYTGEVLCVAGGAAAPAPPVTTAAPITSAPAATETVTDDDDEDLIPYCDEL